MLMRSQNDKLLPHFCQGVLAPREHPLREIASINYFEEIWSEEYVFIGPRPGIGRPGLLAVEGNMLLSLRIPRSRFKHEWVLQAQNLENGKVMWEQTVRQSGATKIAKNKIFVVTTRQITCGMEWRPECESIIVTAYDVDSGNEEWAKKYEGLLNVELLEVKGSSLIIHGSAKHGIRRATYIIDMRDGAFLQSMEAQRGGREIEEIRKPEPIPEDLRFSPLSNLFKQTGSLFFVSQEGRLLAVREEDQTIIGSVQFIPNDLYVSTTDITVTGGKSIVIVYFDDSRQLFAFRFPGQDGEGYRFEADH
jgi:outer membrane protein assembly factor BamB